jgi:lantibiotic leader peptide-processing serine protease
MRRTFLLVIGVALLTASCVEGPTVPPSVVESPALTANLSIGAAEAGRYVVVASSHRLNNGIRGSIAAAGGSMAVQYDEIGVAVVTGLTEDRAAWQDGVLGVELDDEVQWLDNDVEVEVEDADASPESHLPPASAGFFPRQWHMRAIGADKAWAIGRLGSRSVTVTILDTGIDYTHQSLAGLVDLSRSISLIPGDQALITANFPGQNLHPIVDLNRHGTHVASTVASTGHGTAGVTQRVTLVGVKVLSAGGSGPSSGVLAGIMYAADIGSDVINMSLGSTFAKSAFPGRVAAIQRALNYANRKGVVVVTSAGNDNADLDHDGDSFKTYCDGATTVCVSATGPTASAGTNGPWQNIDAKAPYSNYGRSAIDVAAPGGGGTSRSVWAACSSYSLLSTACQASKSFALGINGTSMAAPHVSGLAALLVEDVGRKQPGLVRQRLHQTADDLGDPGTDPIYGKGRINVANAVGAN